MEEGENMKCAKCGAENQTGKFCSECGSPLKAYAPIENLEQEENATTMQHLGNDKYYRKDEKVIQAALEHKVFSDFKNVIMYAGNLFANLDSYFVFVNTDELIFCKINEKKPECDIISRFNYTDNRLENFYDLKWHKLKLGEDVIGFKPNKILTYSNNWEVVYNEVQRLRGKPFSFLQKDSKSKCQSFSSQLKESGYRAQGSHLYEKEKNLSKHEIAKSRIKDNKANGVACCPKCGSTSISANKKGFGVGKAVVGGYLAGPIGLMAGNIHAKKVRVTCLNCGHQWTI